VNSAAARKELAVRTEEAVVLVIVAIVAIVRDLLIVYQIRRGETFAFSSQKWEAPRGRRRETEPRPFWTLIAMQAIFPNAALFYLLWFATSSP
jgi:hypothetical protein